jgi:hypothetical protein
MWRLWGKFYSFGKLKGLMKRFRPGRRFSQWQVPVFAVSSWLSRPLPAVSGGLLPVGGGFPLIPFLSF